MATSTALVNVSEIGDVWKCSICFERFKTPRVLPCSHSFCQGCLSSFIVTVCQSKADPVGFHCPLCREFAPAPRFSASPSEWGKQFPLNQILSEFCSLADVASICEACKRENENEEARKYCFSCSEALCDNCAKYHRRNRILRDHELFDLTEVISGRVLPLKPLMSTCAIHTCKAREIELYCNDHDQPCCAMCVSTDHRKCDSVETIQQKAENLRKTGSCDGLLNDLKETEKKLSNTKSKQEGNILKFEQKSDKITKDIRNEKEELVQLIEKLENECLDEVSQYTKEGREKMTKNTESLNDKLQLVRFCITGLEKFKRLSDEEVVMEFRNCHQKLQHVKNSVIESVCMNMEALVCDELRTLKTVSKFAFLNLIEKVESSYKKVKFDLKKLELSHEVTVQDAGIRGMIFLSSESVLLASRTGPKRILVYSVKELKFEHEVQTGDFIPFDVRLIGKLLYVSSEFSDVIQVLRIDDNYSEVFSFSVGKQCFGMDVYDDHIYIACLSAIIKVDMKGNRIGEYPTSGDAKYVVVKKNGHIVYSSQSNNTVTAISVQGDEVWSYSSPNLKYPYGLEKDSSDNIYVTGAHSNDVHILSIDGNLLRRFINLTNPVLFRLNEEQNIVFVCCEGNNIKIFDVNS